MSLLSAIRWKLRQRPLTEWDLRAARDNAYTDALLRKILESDSNCIDIGAHRGVFLQQFLEFAPKGRHWAFEPIPSMVGELRRDFPQVTVEACALSDHAGEATFHLVANRPAWSGLRAQPYPKGATAQEISVQLKRLDDVIPKDLDIGFIKIDVEGAELEALRGAKETLTRCKPVVLFECAKVHHTNYDTTPEALHALLAECGLSVYLLNQSGPLSAAAFGEIYEASHASGYDRNAWGNFLAAPPNKLNH